MTSKKNVYADVNDPTTSKYRDADAVELSVFSEASPSTGGICAPVDAVQDAHLYQLPDVRNISASRGDTSGTRRESVQTEATMRTVASPRHPTGMSGSTAQQCADLGLLDLSAPSTDYLRKTVSISSPTKEHATEDAELAQFPPTNSYQVDDRVYFTNRVADMDDDSCSDAALENGSFSSDSSARGSPLDGKFPVAETSGDGGARKAKERCQLRIPSSFAICGLIAVGTIIVVVVAFLPLFLVNRSANEATTTFLLTETMKGVSSIARSRAATLPAFVNVVVYHYLPSQVTTAAEANLPATPLALMEALANVISRSSPNIIFLNFVLNASAEDGGLYSLVRYGDTDGILYATWTDTPAFTPLYTLQVNSSGVVTPTPLGTWYDLPERLSNPYGPLAEVVTNWKVHNSSVRWLNNSLASSGVYFNYVLPFRVGNFFGYCEAGLPASSVADEASRLVPSLREHGNLILLDARNGVVINNSWGQPTQWYEQEDGKSVRKVLTVDNISNTIMAQGIQAVMDRGGFNKVLDRDNTALVRFNKNQAFLNLTRITDNFGLDFVIGATVLMQDFEKEFTKATNIVIGVSIGVFVLAIVVAIVIASGVAKQLRNMIPELQKASHLKLTKTNSTESSSFWRRLCSLQFVDELNALQLSYKKLQDSLREMKSYVPAAMLIPISDSSNTNDDSSRDGGGGSGSSDQYQNMQLNANLINDRLNVFETVLCMMVYVEMRIGKDMTLFNTVLSAITERIRTYSGVLEVVGQNYVIISFGAHSNIGDYAKKGMHFVLDAMRSLSAETRDHTVCFVEAGTFKVGACGTKKRCARVVCGTSHMADVARAMWDINSFVATTADTSTRDDKLVWMPMERLHLPDAVHDITLSELIIPEPGETTESYRGDYELFKNGLAKMMAGAYSEALGIFTRVQHDYRGHTVRLKSVCELYHKRKVSTGYCRHVQDPFNVLRTDEDNMAQSGSTRATTEAALASATNAANLSSSSAKGLPTPARDAGESASTNELGGSFAAASSTGPDDNPLFENHSTGSGAEHDSDDVIFDMPDFGATADDPNDDDVFVGSGGDGMLPMKLVDHKGNTWHRSNKPIGTGTFSQVYLGLSENGEQVAIKAVARRSRTYDQRKVVHEILNHAQLVNQNVVKLISYGVTDTCIALILEYVPGGSLQQIKEKFGPLPYTVLRRLVADMCTGLRYLHDSNIVHGDIKPHNMLLGLHGTCKLSDFGTTEQLGAPETAPLDTEDLDVCGTCMYMAPEVARGQKPDMASDIYSLGISILDLALDHIPYNKQPAKQNQFISALGSGEVFLEIPAHEMHKELYDVVRDCCKVDPKDRPTIFQLSTYSFFL